MEGSGRQQLGVAVCCGNTDSRRQVGRLMNATMSSLRFDRVAIWAEEDTGHEAQGTIALRHDV